ncbi:hypothetical protein L207DRAFT_417164 [Hyaloscypha variabilis F]|uniref:Inositol hexakisphosphate and diphosphoinositol-pentakisphosphate kinase n=1 Tax=Hyaloscypha variabilis (strain UAMH 11265 / GT02V1 / F) TaxID=1149755 RepID=A0A2J6S7K0_HYAVF|nr:hypothetical protein L207DRAFT_417164 [Hyaloscypha variabilis F]
MGTKEDPAYQLPEAALRARPSIPEFETKRMSVSSMYSLSSARAGGAPSSAASANGSEVGTGSNTRTPAGPLSPSKSAHPETSTTTISVTTSTSGQVGGHGAPNGHQLTPRDTPSHASEIAKRNAAQRGEGAPRSQPPGRSRSRAKRRFSGSTAASSHSPSSERGILRKDEDKPVPIGIIGVCALDVKARSKPSRNILNRLISKGEFEVVVFGDKVILDEDIENWPMCDFLISFFSDGFPLDKAIAYVKARKPFCVNDVPMQKILWDRRICLMILDKINVPTPKRLEVNRDGGPSILTSEMAQHLKETTGVVLEGPEDGTGGQCRAPRKVELLDDGDTLSVDGALLAKPFVEKPISGEDHNICIYYPKSQGGGARKLFRKIGNKSSEWVEGMTVPRAILEPGSSYIYEKFMRVDNSEDVKAYTVGPTFCHAETRKSPVVDGLVRRNTHGKEIRYVTSLSKDEAAMASRIATSFGQRVCGFDLLRAEGKSYVIDVNGWSFVKDNDEYYDQCARIMRDMFIREKRKVLGTPNSSITSPPSSDGSVIPPVTRKESGLKENHRSTLHQLLSKSPSIKNLHVHHHKKTDVSSPDASSAPTPRTSPPGADKGLELPPVPSAPLLPPPALGISTASAPSTAPSTVPSTPAFGHTTNGELLPPPAPKHTWKLKGMKGGWAGTKVQIKPMFRKPKPGELLAMNIPGFNDAEPRDTKVEELKKSEEAESPGLGRSPTRQDSLSGVTLSRITAAENSLVLDKLQLIVKWGGEPTHSARYQSTELGENMRNDLLLMNREVLDEVHVFSSSERRVTTSAQIFAAAFTDQKELPPDFITVRKDLLDDSNAAKDEMDKVKKKLKTLLRQGEEAPSQFAWPANMPEPSIVQKYVVQLMKFHRRVMRSNYTKLYGGASQSLNAIANPGDNEKGGSSSSMGNAMSQATATNSIQARWCCGEDAELFKERWEKLFAEFCDGEKVDPSKISELYDTMKFDALHNRQFLEWVFTPSKSILAEEEEAIATEANGLEKKKEQPRDIGDEEMAKETVSFQKSDTNMSLSRRMFRRRSMMVGAKPEEAPEQYFRLFTGSSQTKAKTDARLEKLRELYKLAKVLFDFICPQEYGMTDHEKLEIGLLTSLPLLKEIVQDLEEMQASDDAKSFIYFTKESHIYTLLNCILEGGITTKIKRSAIPELDYLSQICFELYESENKTPPDAQDVAKYAYSIRITISPGCHTFDPLDVQLDSKHCISFAPRRSLTAHADWKEVIETLRAKFHTVKLPKSFLAVNLSESHTFHKKEEAEHQDSVASDAGGANPAVGPLDQPHLQDVNTSQHAGSADEEIGPLDTSHLPSPEPESKHDEASTIPPTPDSLSS